jgi:hypothetical protein
MLGAREKGSEESVTRRQKFWRRTASLETGNEFWEYGESLKRTWEASVAVFVKSFGCVIPFSAVVPARPSALRNITECKRCDMITGSLIRLSFASNLHLAVWSGVTPHIVQLDS